MCKDCTYDNLITVLDAKIGQLERDVEYLLAALAVTNTRFAAIDDRDRRAELARSRGVR